jgi:L-ascorbate metabolism protein UlaG (beta-lactamase superfamily)
MKFTYYGHACFAVELQGYTLLFDPFITPNELAKGVDIEHINCDFIFVSHAHADHIADVVSIATRTKAKVICIFEVFEWLSKQGIENIHPMNIGGQWDLDFGKVKCVNAVHSSALPDGSYGGNPMGFVITSNEGNFYYAGDTALTLDMQLIPKWTKLDFAVLPIGDNFTMGVDDALLAADFIQCNKIIGVHYDTFGYIKIDHKAALEKFNSANKELALIHIGETINI